MSTPANAISRGSTGGRGRGNHFKGTGAAPKANLTPDLEGRHARFCMWCGKVNPNQNLSKADRCASEPCRLRVPARMPGGSQRQGWYHCQICDAFIHDNFYFCCMCGTATPDPRGTKRTIVEVRRNLFGKLQNPELFAERKVISTQALGGDAALGTPKKKSEILFHDDTDGDETIASVNEPIANEGKRKRKSTGADEGTVNLKAGEGNGDQGTANPKDGERNKKKDDQKEEIAADAEKP